MTGWLDSHGTYQLPTGWHEVTVKQFCDLAKQPTPTREGAASLFAGRPIQVNGAVADALAFLNTTPPTDGGLPYPENLGQETYLQVELLRQAASKGKLSDWMPQVYGLFTARPTYSPKFDQARAGRQAEHCLYWSVASVYPAVHHCLAELARLTDKYKELGIECSCESCSAAKAAGTHELQALSFFNTLDALAEKQGTTVDAIGQMPYDTVALMLLRASRQHTLQARIHQQSKQG